MSESFRVGLLGAGYVSEFHIAALKRISNVSIVGIADVDFDRARGMADRFQLPQACPSLNNLVEQGANVIHVLTPPASHADCVIEALERGCHVLVEKPLATSVEDCERIEAVAARVGKYVCVNHSNLCDPFVAKAIDLARTGAIGEVVGVDYFRSSNYPPYRGGRLPPQYQAGGYPFRDMGVHGLYIIQAILGQIDDVSAQHLTKGGDPNLLYDEWSAQVRCQRGLGRIRLSWNVKPLYNQLVIEGTHGTLRADMFAMYVTKRKHSRLPSSASRIINALTEACEIGTQVPFNVLRVLCGRIRRFHGLHEMVADFYRCLEAGQRMPVTVGDAKPIVQWTEAVAQQADGAKIRLRDAYQSPRRAKILVTGGAGFVGKHLVSRLLTLGEPLRLLVRSEPPKNWRHHPLVEFDFGDLGDPEAVDRAMHGIHTVYHVGAAMRGAEHDFQRGTVVGTTNIIASALKYKIQKLVYVSSLSVLHAARAKGSDIVREDWPLEPNPQSRGNYSNAKLQAEQLVSDSVKNSGLPAVIVRPGQVIGRGGQLLTPAVGLRFGSTLAVIGNGQVPLPLVHVEDVVDGMLACISKPVFDGTIIHLVDETRVTQDDVAAKLASSSSPPLTVRHIPRWIMFALAGCVHFVFSCLRRSAPLSPYRLKSALSEMHYDCRKAMEVLGWSPNLGVIEGLEDCISPSASGEKADELSHQNCVQLRQMEEKAGRPVVTTSSTNVFI